MADKFQQLVDEDPNDFDAQAARARDHHNRRNTPQFDVRGGSKDRRKQGYNGYNLNDSRDELKDQQMEQMRGIEQKHPQGKPVRIDFNSRETGRAKSNSFSNVELKARPGQRHNKVQQDDSRRSSELLVLPSPGKQSRQRRARAGTFDKDEDIKRAFDGSGTIGSSDDDPNGAARTYFGVEVKRGYGFGQFLALPVLSTSIVVVIAYVNAQLAYMLEDPKMFNAPADQIGQIVSDLTIYSLPFTMLFTCVTSYVYELMGRKWTIFLSFIFTAVIMVAFPYSSPDMGQLLTLRCLLGITMCAPMAHPLIPDYIKRDSRGKAIAVCGIGLVLGEVFSIGVLFNQTKTMTYYNAFLVAGAVVALFGIFLFFVVKDPNMKKIRAGGMSKHSVYAGERMAMSQMDMRSFNRSKRSDPLSDRQLEFGATPQEEMQEEETKKESSNTLRNSSRKKELLPEIVETQTDQEVSQANDTPYRSKEAEPQQIPQEFQFDNQPTNRKVNELNYMVWLEIKENPLLVVLMFGASITKLIGVLFSIYLLLWIQSFSEIRAKNGHQTQLITKQDGKTIYQNIMVISVLVSGFIFPFVGGICDRFSPKYVIPVSFLCRAFTCGAFQFVEYPNGNDALASCIAMIIATIIENISVDTIFAQNLSKETRAIFNGMYSFCGQLGILGFSLSAGWLFDNVGPKAPFNLVCLLDLLYAMLIVCFAKCGIFDKHEAKTRAIHLRSLQSHMYQQEDTIQTTNIKLDKVYNPRTKGEV